MQTFFYQKTFSQNEIYHTTSTEPQLNRISSKTIQTAFKIFNHSALLKNQKTYICRGRNFFFAWYIYLKFTLETSSVFANRKLFTKRPFRIKTPHSCFDKKLMQIMPRRYLRLYDRRGGGANIQKLEEAIKCGSCVFTFEKKILILYNFFHKILSNFKEMYTKLDSNL